MDDAHTFSSKSKSSLAKSGSFATRRRASWLTRNGRVSNRSRSRWTSAGTCYGSDALYVSSEKNRTALGRATPLL
jgi:hypothetical protein